jgi:hypothetical protein
VILASALNDAAPFIVFAAFMLLFSVQARRRGRSVNAYLNARNRETFTNPKPGWWKLRVAGSAVLWVVFWVASGFKKLFHNEGLCLLALNFDVVLSMVGGRGGALSFRGR